LQKRAVFALLFAGLAGGCVVAPLSYEDAADNVSVADVERTTVAVNPKAAWQDSGVYLPEGASARISATGKWSPWPSAGLWSGPEGNEAWKGQVAFIPASALMGRLGTDGKPFYVGPESEIIAKQNGRLYLAMNDLFSALWDNAGEMKATIRVRYPKPIASEPEG
jgi:hypothetical protein